MPDIKAWKCQHGHILGHVKHKGHGDSQLLIFREALDLNVEPPEAQDIVAVMEGYISATVRCSRCQAIRTWAPGPEALKRLILMNTR